MASKKVAIIDYGMGNLYSVRNSFAALGIKTDIVARGEELAAYEKAILPGVGAFGDAMEELERRRFVAAIREFASSGKPFLGICLGAQLLFDKSEEAPGVRGLGVVPGVVKRFSSRLKCPHMGWNKIERHGRKFGIFKGFKADPYAYFCHSYYVKPREERVVAARTQYGRRFASVVKRGNVYGMQFHPEKSQAAGLTLLRNFVQTC